MKNLIYNLILLFVSCQNKVVKTVTKIKIDKVSIGDNYDKVLKKFNIIKETISFTDSTVFIYNTIIINGLKNTLTIIKRGIVTLRNKRLEKIDEKIILTNGIKMKIKKFHLPNNSTVSADNYGGQIFYIDYKNGIVAQYSLISNSLYCYESNIFSQIQTNILNKTNNFKRYKDELNDKP